MIRETITTITNVKTGAGRKLYSAIQKEHLELRGYILLMETEDRVGFWTYSTSAKTLAEILHTEAYHTPGKSSSLRIRAEDSPMLFDILRADAHKYAVKRNDSIEVHTFTSVKRDGRVTHGPEIEPGMFFTMNDGEATGEYFLGTADMYYIVSVTHDDGTVEFVKRPVTRISGAQVITYDSPLGALLAGKFTGEKVMHAGITYKIIKVLGK